MLCSEAIAVNRGGFLRAAAILKCKRWSCELCQDRNRWAVLMAVQRGKPNRMLTLTCSHSQYETPAEAARDMVRGLRALRKRMSRQWPDKKFPMCVVFEAHKSGWPHMHIAMRCEWISISWLKEAWEEITGAFSVNIRFIPDVGRIASYVAKYMGKDLHHFEGCKRWWRTHDYEIEEKDDTIKVRFGFRWERLSASFDDFADRIEADLDFCKVIERRAGWIEWEDWAWDG